VQCTPRAVCAGHSVQTLSNYFDHLLNHSHALLCVTAVEGDEVFIEEEIVIQTRNLQLTGSDGSPTHAAILGLQHDSKSSPFPGIHHSKYLHQCSFLDFGGGSSLRGERLRVQPPRNADKNFYTI